MITGAFAERAKFGPLLIFTALWSLLVYVPLAHWVFAYEGWLRAFSTNAEAPDIGLNSLDFAGGLAIHVNAGVAAIAAVMVFGKRKGYGKEPMEPHDITMVVLGAAILWVGWFGFNAGSAGGATPQAVTPSRTRCRSGTRWIMWTLASWQFGGKPSGRRSRAVLSRSRRRHSRFGLRDAVEAIIIGGVAGVLCYGAVRLRAKLSFDDSLDVVGVHGVGGMWGALATGIFANSAVSGIPYAEGIMQGEWGRFTDALIGIGAIGAYSFIVTFVILKVLDVTMGIRVNEEEEELGLDSSQHGERAYTLDEAGGMTDGSGPVMQAPPAAYGAASPGGGQ